MLINVKTFTINWKSVIVLLIIHYHHHHHGFLLRRFYFLFIIPPPCLLSVALLFFIRLFGLAGWVGALLFGAKAKRKKNASKNEIKQ